MTLDELQLTERDIARFWLKVDKTPGYGPWGNCWKWVAALNNKTGGYGRFTTRKGGKKFSHGAHVLSFLLAGGQNPGNLNVLHTCDTRDCVHFEHLTVGSHAANTSDMISKGRHVLHGKRARFGGNHGVRIRLADIAVSRGVSLARLQETSGLPPASVASIWYNRVHYIPLEALGRLSELLEVQPGELLEKAA